MKNVKVKKYWFSSIKFKTFIRPLLKNPFKSIILLHKILLILKKETGLKRALHLMLKRKAWVSGVVSFETIVVFKNGFLKLNSGFFAFWIQEFLTIILLKWVRTTF